MRRSVSLVVIAAVAIGVQSASIGLPTAEASAVSRDLARYLVRADEEPGFRPTVRRPVVSSAKAWVRGMPAAVAAATIKRYAVEGFVAATGERMKGADGAEGIDLVNEFKSHAGAMREMTWLIHWAHPTRRFAVNGVPSAAGTIQVLASTSAANVYWVQGRCTLGIGDYLPHSVHPLTSPLIKAAQTLYRRTGGSCP